MMTDKDETFEKSDISYDALARLIFNRDVELETRKHGSKMPY